MKVQTMEMVAENPSSGSGSEGLDASYDSPNGRSHASGQIISYSPNKKRRYGSDEVAVDRISRLPNCLLLHILDLLDMKDAVKTGVLSKRWARLWTYMCNLVYYGSRKRKFIDFVSHTLMLHNGCKIKKFILADCGYQRVLHSEVDEWLHQATVKGVEELHLGFDPFPKCYGHAFYLVPQHLYSNSSLTKLSFRYCDLLPSGLIYWKSLKSLSIGEADLSNDVVQAILLGSPALEYLKLQEGWSFNRIDFTSHGLKKFVIDSYLDYEVSKLELVGPNLHSLEISGYFSRTKCRLINVRSLDDATLDFDMFFDDWVEHAYERLRDLLWEQLKNLKYVKELTVGHWCIWVLSIWEMRFLPSPLSKHKCLILKTDLSKRDFPGIASLLQSSPYLEKLVVNLAHPHETLFEFYPDSSICFDFDGDEYWASQTRTFNCLLLHLRRIEIFGCESYETFELVPSFVQFLLKNAKVLETMVIYKESVEDWKPQCHQKVFYWNKNC